jgi:hypothetical protein
MNRLEKVLERIEKSVNISFAGPTPTSLLARQDLESAIVVLSDRQTPFRDRVSRIKGEGLAHLWNQRTRLDNVADGPAGLVDLFYADGNLPSTTDPNYVQQTAAYKYLGTTAIITGPMIASGRSYIDIEAEVAEATLRRIIQAEEWADFKGSTTINSLSYNGFDNQLVTNVLSAAGASLVANGTTIPLFDRIIKLIRIQGGSKLDGIYCSFGQQNVINQIVSPAARYVISLDSRENLLAAGDHVVSYTCAMGPIPVIGDFFANPALPYPFVDPNGQLGIGSSGATGNIVSNVYFIRHDEQGCQMVDLVTLGRTELAKIADTVRFYVNTYLVLAVKAEPWLGALTNVLEPS